MQLESEWQRMQQKPETEKKENVLKYVNEALSNAVKTEIIVLRLIMFEFYPKK